MLRATTTTESNNKTRYNNSDGISPPPPPPPPLPQQQYSTTSTTSDPPPSRLEQTQSIMAEQLKKNNPQNFVAHCDDFDVLSASGNSLFYGFASNNSNESGCSNDKIIDSMEQLEDLNIEDDGRAMPTGDLIVTKQELVYGKEEEEEDEEKEEDEKQEITPEKVQTIVDDVSIVEIKSSSVSSSEEHCHVNLRLENNCDNINFTQQNYTATAINKTREIDNYCTVSESSSEFPQSNTSGDHSVERRLALLAKKRPQLNLSEKINNWVRETDVSDVEDVANFERAYNTYVERQKKSHNQTEISNKTYIDFEQFYEYLLQQKALKMASRSAISDRSTMQFSPSTSGISVIPKKRPLKYNKLMKSKEREQNQYSSSDNDMIDYGPSKRKKPALEKNVNTVVPNMVYHEKPLCPSSSEDNSLADCDGNRIKVNSNKNLTALKNPIESIKRRNLLPTPNKTKNSNNPEGKDNFFNLNRLIRQIDKDKPVESKENGLIKIRYDFVREVKTNGDDVRNDEIFKRPIPKIHGLAKNKSLFHYKDITSQEKSLSINNKIPNSTFALSQEGKQSKNYKPINNQSKLTNELKNSGKEQNGILEQLNGTEKDEFCNYLGLAGMSTTHAISNAVEELSKCPVARRSLRVRQLKLQEKKSKGSEPLLENGAKATEENGSVSENNSDESNHSKSPINTSPPPKKNPNKTEASTVNSISPNEIAQAKEYSNKLTTKKDLDSSCPPCTTTSTINTMPVVKIINIITEPQKSSKNMQSNATSSVSVNLETSNQTSCSNEPNPKDLHEEIRVYFEKIKELKPSICIRQTLCNVNQSTINEKESAAVSSKGSGKAIRATDVNGNKPTEEIQQKNNLEFNRKNNETENAEMQIYLVPESNLELVKEIKESDKNIEIEGNRNQEIEKTPNPQQKVNHDDFIDLTEDCNESMEAIKSADDDAVAALAPQTTTLDNKDVETVDGFSQTDPIPLPLPPPPPTPPSNGFKVLSSSLECIANPLNRANGEISHIFFELDTLIVIQEKTISFWKFENLPNALMNFQRKHNPKTSAADDSTEDSLLESAEDVNHPKTDPNKSPLKSEWIQLGTIERAEQGIELKSPHRNRLCVINSTPVYLEARCELLTHGERECEMVSLFINVYYFDKENSIAKYQCINLDTLACSPEEIMYTTLTDSHYFVLCWNYTNGTSKKVSARICKYALTPQLRTLASIREFRTLRHGIYQVECFLDKLIGLGDTQLTVWDHFGDILMDYDLKTPLGRNLGFIIYSNNSTDANNTILLFQCLQCNNNNNNNNNNNSNRKNNNNNNNINNNKNNINNNNNSNGKRTNTKNSILKVSENDERTRTTTMMLSSNGNDQECSQLEVFACRIAHGNPKYHRFHSIKSSVLDEACNSNLTSEHLIITNKMNEEIWISRANPSNVFFASGQNSQRFYSRNTNQVIEVTKSSLTVDGIANHLLKLACNNMIITR